MYPQAPRMINSQGGIMTQHRVDIPGSERAEVQGAQRIGRLDPDKRIDVTVMLPRRRGANIAEAIEGLPLDRATFAEQLGADPQDIDRLERFATDHRLEDAQASQARRTVVLRGTIAAIEKAFGADLALYEHPELGTFRGRID